MEFFIHRERDFDGTAYVEIGPGTYSGKHWQPGYLFIDEDDFFPAEQALRTHVSNYDHYDMNNIAKDVGERVIAEWRITAANLSSKKESAAAILDVETDSDSFRNSLESDRGKIAAMLSELADSCESFCEKDSGFCVLGL